MGAHLDRCSMEASACICNSKQVESSFSQLLTIVRGKGNLDIFQMSALYNYDTTGLDAVILCQTNQSIGLHTLLDCLKEGKPILWPGTILRATR